VSDDDDCDGKTTRMIMSRLTYLSNKLW